MTSILSKGYSIHTGTKVFSELNRFLAKNNYSSYFILCDENTFQHCLPKLITASAKLRTAAIIEIESGESSKSLDFCAHIWQTLLESHADRKTLLIHLGGGVVSDLGGFTASAYKRGVDFINVPTSLLAMADASVGGKTGIDFHGIKNVLGNFTQPKAVFIYPPFLETLNERHFKNGLAEIYKMALISDKAFWNILKKEQPQPEFIIHRSVHLKNKIVLKDPNDVGVRNILNFGHSLGHALEAHFLGTANELLHGEAIVAGMILESHIAFQKNRLSKKELDEIVNVFQTVFVLPSLVKISLEDIVPFLKQDKKALKNKYLFSLLSKIGACEYNIQVTEIQIQKSLFFYSSITA